MLVLSYFIVITLTWYLYDLIKSEGEFNQIAAAGIILAFHFISICCTHALKRKFEKEAKDRRMPKTPANPPTYKSLTTLTGPETSA